MKEIRKQLVLRWDELLLILAVEAGMYLIGQIVLAIIVSQMNGKDETIFELGTVMAIMGSMFLLVFMGMSTLALCFNIGISHGAVRRRFVPMCFLFTYLEFLITAMAAFLFHHLDLLIIRHVYSDMENEFDMGIILKWDYILTAGLVIVGIHALFGALLVKYGKIAFIILWALWVGTAGGVSRFSNIMEKYKDTAMVKFLTEIIHSIAGISQNGILSAVAAISMAMIIISWLLLRKQQVMM